MHKLINIAGTDYPVSFGLFALKSFEDATGIGSGDLVNSISKKPISVSLDLFYFAFKDGFRKAKKEFTLTQADIADLVDQDREAMDKLFAFFGDSQPAATEETSETGIEKK